MAWIIASIPFWLLGLFFLLCTLYVVPRRRPEETAGDLVAQVIFCAIAGGVFWIIAAKVAS